MVLKRTPHLLVMVLAPLLGIASSSLNAGGFQKPNSAKPGPDQLIAWMAWTREDVFTCCSRDRRIPRSSAARPGLSDVLCVVGAIDRAGRTPDEYADHEVQDKHQASW